MIDASEVYRPCYSHPALGAPYGSPYNPFEDAYRYSLRILEDSYQRQKELLYRYSGGAMYSESYRQDEYDIDSRFHYACECLYRRYREQQMYYYNPPIVYNRNRYSGWDRGYGQSYAYKFTYLNSTTGETTPVMPTETKSYIIKDNAEDCATYHGEGFADFKTFAEAEKEAQKLARENPDLEFTVYETKRKYKVADKPLDVTSFI